MFGGDHIIILIVILIVAVLIFGPGKLGDVGGAIGKSIREFRKSASGESESGSSQDS